MESSKNLMNFLFSGMPRFLSSSSPIVESSFNTPPSLNPIYARQNLRSSEKDQMLQETNKAMMRKLGESSADNSLPMSLEGTVAQRIPCSCQPARSDDFFVPLECNSTLHNGYNHSEIPDQDQMSSVNSEQNVNHFIPG